MSFLPDLYFTEEGDIALSPAGDLLLTQTSWRDDVQQAYVRIMTDVGDYLLYPTMGANLCNLFGMPQSSTTGDYGVALIEGALARDGRFAGKPFSATAIPTGPQSIRFDVFVRSGSSDQVRLSVEQNLGLDTEGTPQIGAQSFDNGPFGTGPFGGNS